MNRTGRFLITWNAGQSDVSGFVATLTAPVTTALQDVSGLQIYVGYHGTAVSTMHPTGNFDRAFTHEEMAQVHEMTVQFSNLTLH